MDQRYEFRNNDHDESVVHPRFGFGRVGILRRFSAYSDYGSRVEVTRLVPYIYKGQHCISAHQSLQETSTFIMSKGTVHQIAAGGFGSGTNDLVRRFTLAPLCVQVQ
jgi:hypothetical protein